MDLLIPQPLKTLTNQNDLWKQLTNHKIEHAIWTRENIPRKFKKINKTMCFQNIFLVRRFCQEVGNQDGLKGENFGDKF